MGVIVADSLDGARERITGPVVATIGNFDGLHRGHQAIMERVVARARASDARAAVVSFTPHPLRILAPDRAPRMLMTRDQKLRGLEALGLDAAVLLPFDRELAGMPAEAFAERVLAVGLRVSEVYVGPDFRFGRGRAGDVALLARLGQTLGFTVAAIDPVLDGGERISASRIRTLLAAGDAVSAARLLGRPFALGGTVVHGEGRGRVLLVPTANLAVENEFLPARGVYVTRTRWDSGERHGLTNVGVRPTFGDPRLVVETFLPGWEGDLYGTRIELDLLEKLRDEKKFDSPEDLRAQIGRDLEAFEAWERERR